MITDTDLRFRHSALMWWLPQGTPAWEELTPEEQVSSIEALLAADYAAEQAQQEALRTIWIGPECVPPTYEEQEYPD